MSILGFVLTQHLATWNRLVPRCAVLVEQHPARPNHVRYLHPTKGWRNVHKSRFGSAIGLLPEMRGGVHGA